MPTPANPTTNHPEADFLGSWLVSEYIYNPDGTFAGINHQRRMLHTHSNVLIRVTQICEPEASLDGNPMARFAGEWVFDLSVDGRIRRYLGPDVIGNGITWGAGAMTGTGIWPRFGYGFSSFAVLPSEDRQLTGGRFHIGPELIANIAGIAVPDDGINRFPKFEGPSWPGDVSLNWAGSSRTISSDGEVIDESPVHRVYNAFGWSESETVLQISTIDSGLKIEGSIRGEPFLGFAHRYGFLNEWEAVVEDQTTIESTELLDPLGGHLVEVRKYFSNQILHRVEITSLKPKKI